MSEQIFNIQRIYVKESSFIAENTPKLFRQLSLFEHEMELQVGHTKLEEENYYEVVLDISVITRIKQESKEGEKKEKGKEADKEKPVAFIVKVKQAGVFQLAGFEKEELEQLLEVHCPELIYPYARQVVSELTVMGSLPPVTLAPLSFRDLNQQD